METSEALRIVRGAVATKDLVPVLTHFHLYNGRVQGGNGRIAIEAPVPEFEDLDVTVPAKRFLAAVDSCDGDPTMQITDKGRLSMRKGPFRASLPLESHEHYPKLLPEGEATASTGGVLDVLDMLHPFVSKDASRPWSRGVLIKEGFAYATNNIVLVRAPVPWKGDAINVPAECVAELARVRLPVTHVQQDERSITFHFEGGAWLRSSLFSLEWPDLDRFFAQDPPEQAITADMCSIVEELLPFVEDATFPKITLHNWGVSVADASYDVTLPVDGEHPISFHASPLLEALRIAETWDLSEAPYTFSNAEGVRGVLMPMRA
jgi:DNA polymerase III sliding clamp (beta) subunit (PCNA family)